MNDQMAESKGLCHLGKAEGKRECLLHCTKVARKIIAEEQQCKQNLRLNPALRYHLHQGHSVFIRKEPYGVETIFGQIWAGLDPLPVGTEDRADVRLSVLHGGVGESKGSFQKPTAKELQSPACSAGYCSQNQQ